MEVLSCRVQGLCVQMYLLTYLILFISDVLRNCQKKQDFLKHGSHLG